MIKPEYYGNKSDVIDYLYEHYDDASVFMIGNIIKYVTRYKEKNGREDLEKAHTYLQRLIDQEYPDTDSKKEEKTWVNPETNEIETESELRAKKKSLSLDDIHIEQLKAAVKAVNNN